MKQPILSALALMPLLFAPEWLAAAEAGQVHLNLTQSWVGYASLVLFVLAYTFVMAEEFTHLRKSKPVMLAAGVIWAMIAISPTARI